MIRVNQTVVDKGFGNCVQAVLASIFEKDINDVVNIIDHIADGWAIPFMDWVESVGYEYVGVMNPAETQKETLNDLASQYAIGGYFYGVVPSRNFEDITHAVVLDRQGNVVHDPNPKKQWEGINVVETDELKYWYRFEPLTA